MAASAGAAVVPATPGDMDINRLRDPEAWGGNEEAARRADTFLRAGGTGMLDMLCIGLTIIPPEIGLCTRMTMISYLRSIQVYDNV